MMVEEKWGVIRDNQQTGAVKAIINGTANLTLGKFAMTSLRNKYMKPSLSYFTSPLILVIPPGRLYSPLEALSRPFTNITWTSVVIILMICFSIVAIVRWKMNFKVQNFILGSGNNSPYFNIINVSLGGSLSNLPTRNFARSILCMFMIYCLVIRSSYQGALFNFIQSQDRHPPIDSIREMVQMNYNFYMIPSAVEQIQQLQYLYKRRIIISPAEGDKIRERLASPDFKSALLSSLEQILYFNQINKNNYTLEVSNQVLID